jgi:hypothetical protein
MMQQLVEVEEMILAIAAIVVKAVEIVVVMLDIDVLSPIQTQMEAKIMAVK